MRVRINQLFWFLRDHIDFWIVSDNSKIVGYDLHHYRKPTMLVLENYNRYPLIFWKRILPKMRRRIMVGKSTISIVSFCAWKINLFWLTSAETEVKPHMVQGYFFGYHCLIWLLTPGLLIRPIGTHTPLVASKKMENQPNNVHFSSRTSF